MEKPVRIYQRQSKILKVLLQHEDAVTSKYLSHIIGVSSRTIREDMRQLAAALQERNIALDSVPGSGYSISQSDREKALNFLNDTSDQQYDIPTLPQDRVRFLIQKLLFASGPVTMEDLAIELYVSKSTIEKDIEKVDNWLALHHLQLLKKPSFGMQVKGDEVGFRYAMVNCIYNDHPLNQTSSLNWQSRIIEDETIHKIKQIIYNIQNKPFINISDSHYIHLVNYLAITLHRFQQKQIIPSSIDAHEGIPSKRAYLIAKEITDEIEHALHIRLPEIEIIYIAKYLLQVDIFEIRDMLPENIACDVDDSLFEFVTELITTINEKHKNDFSTDTDLFFSLVLYSNTLINRNKHKIYKTNSSLREIKKGYPDALEMAITTSEKIKDQYPIQINENEIGDIALYFCAAIERQKIGISRKPRKVVIICSSGIGGSQLLRVKLQRYFPNLKIDGVFPAYRLPEAIQNQPDLILSTVPLTATEIPVLQVSQLLNDNDLQGLRDILNEGDYDKKKGQRAFSQLFNAALFFPGLEFEHKEDVIRFLNARLIENGYGNETFTQAVLEREALFSTAIGNLVAIPHALSQSTKGSRIVVGVLNKPIPWGEEKAQIIFLLNIENSTDDEFSRIYEQFFDIINSKMKISELIKSKNFDQFMQIING
jgi:lichenan operon transcriptional antiterminator